MKNILLISLAVSQILFAQKFTVDPAKGVPGGTYILTVTQKDCTEPGSLDSNIKLRSGLTGLGIGPVSDDSSALTCKAVWKATVAPDTPLGPTSLSLVREEKEQKTKLLEIIPFEVVPVLPGPLPPGLNPQVDVMWKVMPWRNTADSFGRRIANQYFCIQVTIGNNSGFPIQFTSLGFITKEMRELPNSGGLSGFPTGVPPLPNDPYNFPRSTIEKEQQVGKRALVLNSTLALGALMTASSSLFSSTFGSGTLAFGRYEQVAALMNPVASSMQVIWPDRTTRHLVSLDTRAFRDGMIVPSNVPTSPLVVFISREIVECDVKKCAGIGSAEPKVRGFTRIPDNKKHFNPHQVMEALGDLVLEGQPIKYLPRVSVSGNKIQLTPVPPVINPQTTPEYNQESTNSDLVLTGNGLSDVKVAVDDASKVKATIAVIDADGKSLSLKIVVADDAPPGPVILRFSNAAGSATFPIKVKAAKPSFKLDPASTTQKDFDGKASLDVKLVEGKHLKGAKFQQDAADATPSADGATLTLKIPKNSEPHEFKIKAIRDGAESDQASFKLKPSAPEGLTVTNNKGVKGGDVVHVSVTGKYLTGVRKVEPEKDAGLTVDQSTVKPPKPEDETQTLTFDVSVKDAKIPSGTEKVWKLTLVNDTEKTAINFTVASK